MTHICHFVSSSMCLNVSREIVSSRNNMRHKIDITVIFKLPTCISVWENVRHICIFYQFPILQCHSSLINWYSSSTKTRPNSSYGENTQSDDDQAPQVWRNVKKNIQQSVTITIRAASKPRRWYLRAIMGGSQLALRWNWRKGPTTVKSLIKDAPNSPT